MTAIIERKVSPAGVTTIKSADKGEARVRFSTPDGRTPDRDREVTATDALHEGTQVVVSPFGHRSITEGAIPAGRATIHRDGTADLKLFLDTEAGRETFGAIKGLQEITQYSYGLRVLEEGELTTAMRAAGAVRYLKRLEVVEISPVVQAAGLNTATLDLKSCGCGVGSTCGCKKQPSRAEMEAIAAESRRILAKGARLLAPPPLSYDQMIQQIAAVNWELGITPAETQVERERHDAASKAAAWVAAQWRCHPPIVKWYSRHTLPNISTRGVFYPSQPDAIWLRSNLFGKELLSVICHEGSHYGRRARGLPQDEVEVEADTSALLRRYAEEMGA